MNRCSLRLIIEGSGFTFLFTGKFNLIMLQDFAYHLYLLILSFLFSLFFFSSVSPLGLALGFNSFFFPFLFLGSGCSGECFFLPSSLVSACEGLCRLFHLSFVFLFDDIFLLLCLWSPVIMEACKPFFIKETEKSLICGMDSLRFLFFQYTTVSYHTYIYLLRSCHFSETFHDHLSTSTAVNTQR